MAADPRGPDAPRDVEVAEGEDWTSDGDYTITWRNPDHSRPIKAALYRVCRVEDQRRCVDAQRVEKDVDRVRVRVNEPGDYTFTVRLKDQDGRKGERSRAVHLRFDDELPTSDGFDR